VLAPEGTEVNATLCCARLSWSVQVIVVPGATLMLAGAKLAPLPAPWGIVIVVPLDPPEPEPLVVALPVPVVVQVIVLVVSTALLTVPEPPPLVCDPVLAALP